MGTTHLSGLQVAGVPTFGVGGGLPLAPRYFFVSSTAANTSNGNDGSFDAPFATLDYAIGQCTANKGDTIVVLPNHAETITGVGGITADIAGINIIGQGVGAARPTFLMDGATDVTFVVSAANVTVQNMFFKAGHSGVVTCFNITAGSCNLINLEFGNNTTNENFVTPIKATSTADNNADGLTVIGCKWFTIDTDDREMIEINANLDKLTVLNNTMVTMSATTCPLILSAGTKVLSNVDIGWNRAKNAMTSGALFISNGASTNSGFVYNNYVGNLDTTGPQDLGASAFANAYWFNNQSSSVVTLSGAVNPAPDSPTT